MEIEGELHVMLNRDSGHIHSVDCWCEPVRIYLATVRGLPGLTKIIEHEDYHAAHHIVVLSERERDRAIPYDSGHTRGTDEPWITRALSIEPPTELPPDPNERSF
jgi:hypothetical protein